MQGSFKIRNEPKAMPEVYPGEGLYLLGSANIEAITTDPTLFWQRLEIYPAKGVTAGVLTANAADIYVGLSGVAISVTLTQLTFSGPHAVATKAAHGFRDRQTVAVSGATPALYNGLFQIFSPTPDTFSYRPLTAPTGPATGTITAASVPYLPDLLVPTATRLILTLPLGQKCPLTQVIVKGTATDGVFYRYT